MGRFPFLFAALSLLLCSTSLNGQNMDLEKNEQKDRAILKSVFSSMADSQASSTSELMIWVGNFFSGSPYVEHTLEEEPENLVVNLREFDCTTFAENCLAISRTIKSGTLSYEQFTSELRGIRYRKGRVDGYASRIHYFSDWIYLSNQKQLIRDVSKELGGSPQRDQFHEYPSCQLPATGFRSIIDWDSGHPGAGDICKRAVFYFPGFFT